MIPVHIPTALMIAATALTLALAMLVWHRKRGLGWWYFGLLMLAIAGWDLTSALEYLSGSFAMKVFWSKAGIPFVVACAPLWLNFVASYTRKDNWLRPRMALLLWLLPVVTILLTPANWHGAVWTSMDFMTDRYGARVIYHHGAAIWAIAVYSYAILSFCTVWLLLWSRKAAAIYVTQSRTLAFASLIPWVSNLIYLFKLIPVKGIDTTPLSFGLMGLVVGWSILRQGFLDLAPIAYDKLFSVLRSGVLVTDSEGRYVLANRSALKYFDLQGLHPGDKLTDDQRRMLEGCGEANAEMQLTREGQELWVEISSSPLEQRDSSPAGQLYILRNITERKQREREKEQMIAALEKSLSEIKRLQGLLPICMHCKKIRNDKGYWEHVEMYVSEHSEAVFTHSICPDCLEKNYGTYLKKQ